MKLTLRRSKDAYQKRLWGVLEELCGILADKPLPAVYQDWTSADIGLRMKVGFSSELSILLQTYAGEITAAAEADPALCEQLMYELAHAAAGFEDLSENFKRASREARVLSDHVSRIHHERLATGAIGDRP